MSALFSPDRLYRYTLWRDSSWAMLGEGENTKRGTLNVIGLNPSTADERKDDPTIRRCVALRDRLRCDRLVMTNLFAFRATDPEAMKAAADPVGLLNNHHLLAEANHARIVIAAWGVHGAHRGRASDVLALLRASGVPVLCLGKTKDGHPRHPLYLRRDVEPVEFDVVERSGA